jgi:hypothetical protein
MAGYKLVDISENDTGGSLFSEVLGIPLIFRGEPNTPLATPKFERKPLLFGGRTLCEVLGLPSVIPSSGKRLTGHDTTFGRFLPELWR